jgi:hypothetical protein
LATNPQNGVLRRLVQTAQRLIEAKDNQMVTAVEWREMRRATAYAARWLSQQNRRRA